ncbi:MAG: Flp pilus assembly complex ATPase component TadA [Candidatus Omnitrophica bacterium]|nr:Flp pilus assembly complex ATPase component TadA [Candidatus Omnitrophota bacterium]
MRASIKNEIIEALHAKGLADKDKLQDVFKAKSGISEKDFVSKIIEMSGVADIALAEIISDKLNVPMVALSRVNVDKSVLGMIPEKIATKYNAIAISKIGSFITVAFYDPTNVFAVDDIKAVTGCDVAVAICTRNEVISAIRKYYHGQEEITELLDHGPDGESDMNVSQSLDFEMSGIGAGELDAAPIVKIVTVIIAEAIKRRASDIHIEPQENTLKVRYRVDGELLQVFDLPKKNQNAVIARIKIMSNLDITENRMPQDGRFRVKLENREIDFRVSVLPAIYGNKIVMRALDKANLSIGLESMGFLPSNMDDFKTALARPFGIVLITGPTGSGKSTTLYSILNRMNVPERHILTVEDPVEYQVSGITQVAVHQGIGLTFASSLRAILRQTPDVIMIGEIRDFETADIAIKASLTGHMVLSTLHTNDSIGSITRLVNMGVEPFLISSSLVMACAQRLLRRICLNCKEEIEMTANLKAELEEKYPEVRNSGKFYGGRGCSKCNNTGYYGRMGNVESFLVDKEVASMITKRAGENEIRGYLRTKGFRTLRENAVTQACLGHTTFEEVFRVT